jgi:hypothetical protein
MRTSPSFLASPAPRERHCRRLPARLRSRDCQSARERPGVARRSTSIILSARRAVAKSWRYYISGCGSGRIAWRASDSLFRPSNCNIKPAPTFLQDMFEPYGRKAMDRRELIAVAGSVAAVTSTSPAFAQRGGAFLDHAVPGVGLTVSGPVRELRLNFTMDVVGAFSDVQVTSSTGAVIPASGPAYDPSSQQVVIIKFRRALPARHLYGEMAYGLGLWAFDLGNIPLHGHLSGRCVVHLAPSGDG